MYLNARAADAAQSAEQIGVCGVKLSVYVVFYLLPKQVFQYPPLFSSWLLRVMNKCENGEHVQ